MLANNIVVADAQVGLLAFVSHVLRCAAEHRARMNFIVFADLGATGEIGMRHHARAALDFDLSLDNDVGTDLGAGVDLGLGVYDGRGMNRH